jgi:hypothetical protein
MVTICTTCHNLKTLNRVQQGCGKGDIRIEDIMELCRSEACQRDVKISIDENGGEPLRSGKKQEILSLNC